MRQRLIRFANPLYRAMKDYCLKRRPPLLTPLFFHALAFFDRLLTGRRPSPEQVQADRLWKQRYLDRWERDKSRLLRVQTGHPVALSSDDHIHPRGSVHDNSVNLRFNQRIYEALGRKKDISLLDLGCSGGGLVRSFLEDGHTAVGLEGSDASQRSRSGEWGTVPYHLFTCDLTKPFRVVDDAGKPFLFDAVTAWEVLEHIPKEALGGLIENVRAHLKPGGYFIGSVDLLPDGNPLTGAVYHLTLEPPDWWRRQFTDRGFVTAEPCGFQAEDMVRGHGMSLKDWHPEDGTGIHLVLRKTPLP